MKKSFSIIIVSFLLSFEVSGQFPPVPDQYVLNPILINPAAAGIRETFSLSALYRRQWVGIEGAPETIMLIGDSPVFSGNTGVGLSILRDNIGVTRETSVSGSYSYGIRTGEGTLAFGLKAGIISTNTAWSELTVLDPGDEAYLADSRAFLVPDFGFGTYLMNEKYYAGFSVPRLLGYRFNFDKNRYSVRIDPGDYLYLLQGGFIYDIYSGIKFQPSALISLSPGTRTLVDINAHFSFSEKMWAGLSFRTNKSFSALIQFALNNHLKAAYSNYIDFGKLGRFSKGTHEIMLRFDFMYHADVVNPLIF